MTSGIVKTSKIGQSAVLLPNLVIARVWKAFND